MMAVNDLNFVGGTRNVGVYKSRSPGSPGG